MEVLLVIGVVVLLIWYGNARAKEARRRDAGAFTYDHPDGYSSYVVNFKNGSMHYLWRSPDPDPSDPNNNRDYELRRDEDGHWFIRLTNDSWARALQQANVDTESLLPTIRKRAEREIRSLGKKPSWEELHRDLVSLVESRYQTYLDVR